MTKIFYILSLIFLFSCSVQKRKYQKGFYVSSHKIKSQTKKDNNLSLKEAKSEAIVYAPVEEPEHAIKTEASVNKKIAPVKPDQKPSLFITKDEPCDIIVLKNGTEVKAKILEISPIEVKYKKCDLPDGPLYIVEKTDVFMVKYANGTKEVFKSEASDKTATNNNSRSSDHQPRVSNDYATLSLVFGILGFLILFGSIAAIVLGDKALKEMAASPNKYTNEGEARVGKILGIVGLVLKILLFILLIFVFSTII